MINFKANGLLRAVSAHKKGVYTALGIVGGVTLLGVTAMAVWNSKRLRTVRALRCTERTLYRVGTAMRDLSGMDCGS